MTIDCLPCLLWDVCISQRVTRCVAIHFQWKGQLSVSICFSLIFPSSQRVNSPLVTLSKSLKPRLFPSWPWRHFSSSQFFLSSQPPWLTLPRPFQPQFPIVPFFQLASVVLVKTRAICQVYSTSTPWQGSSFTGEVPKCKQDNHQVLSFSYLSGLIWAVQFAAWTDGLSFIDVR